MSVLGPHEGGRVTDGRLDRLGSANAIVSPSRLHPKAIIDSCCDNRLLSPDMAKTYGGKDPAGVVLVRKGLDGDVEL